MIVVTSPIDTPRALSYRLPIGHEPLNGLVSEKISIKDSKLSTHWPVDWQ